MLDSRYIYLHQSLGLGPMWLSNNAVVIKQSAIANQTEAINQATATNQTETSNQATVTNQTETSNQATLANPTKPLSTTETISTKTAITVPKEQVNQATPIESETFTRLKLNGLSSQFISKSGQKIFCFTISSSTDSNTPFPDNYAQLMDQLMATLSNEPITWQFIRDVDGANWLNKFEAALNLANADIIVFLSEMIATEVAIEQLLSNYNSKIINIPHPARLISISQLKSKVWEDLATLLY